MTDLKKRAQDLRRAYTSVLKHRIPHAPHVLVQRDAYLKPAFVGNLAALSTAADKQQARATVGSDALRPLRMRLNALRNRVTTFLTAAEVKITPLHDRPEWPEIRRQVIDRLKEQTTATRAAALANKFGAYRMNDVSKAILDPLNTRASALDEASVSWQSITVGAQLARSVAAFNELPGPDRIDDVAALRRWLNESVRTLEQRRKAIWQALRERDLDAVAAASKDLGKTAAGDTMKRALETAHYLARRRLDGAAWTLGPEAVAGAEIIRDLLLAQALAHRTEWIAGTDLGAAATWRAAAQRLPFPTRWRTPAPTKIQTFWARPTQYNGKLVTIEGVVGRVTNAHIKRKVVSSTWLSAADGTGMRVGVTHMKLDSGGLVAGAYARVTGVFRAMDPEFGTPAVRVEQRQYENDSRSSWTDWVTFNLRQLFVPVPHGLTMQWSWELGAYGAGNQLRYGTWLPFRTGD